MQGAAFRLGGFSYFGHQDSDEGLEALVERLNLDFQPIFRNYLYYGFGRGWSITESQPYVSSLLDDCQRLFHQLESKSERGVVLHHTMDWLHLLAMASALSLVDTPGTCDVRGEKIAENGIEFDRNGIWPTPRRISGRVRVLSFERH